VCCYAMVSICLLLVFAAVGNIMLILQDNQMGYVQDLCQETPELSELSILNFKKYSDEAVIIKLKPLVETIDSAIVQNINNYMCS